MNSNKIRAVLNLELKKTIFFIQFPRLHNLVEISMKIAINFNTLLRKRPISNYYSNAFLSIFSGILLSSQKLINLR